jgi:hypothetical protein
MSVHCVCVKYAYMLVCYYLFSVTYIRKNFHLSLNIGGTLKTKGLSPAWIKPLNNLIGLGEYHSLFVLSYDRSMDFSKASSPYSAIYLVVLLFQFPSTSRIVSSSNSCLRLFLSPYPSFLFPSITCFKAIPTQDILTHLAFLLFIVCRTFLSSLTLCKISSLFPRAVLLIINKYVYTKVHS